MLIVNIEIHHFFSLMYICNNLSARVDVEAPEFESESFRVLVFRNLDIQVINGRVLWQS